jgi:hypothetical protein
MNTACTPELTFMGHPKCPIPNRAISALAPKYPFSMYLRRLARGRLEKLETVSWRPTPYRRG